MKVVRVLLLLVIAYFVAMAAAGLLFFATAWAVGQLDRGIHSDVAFVYLIALPVGWLVAFCMLYRSKFLAGI